MTNKVSTVGDEGLGLAISAIFTPHRLHHKGEGRGNVNHRRDQLPSDATNLTKALNIWLVKIHLGLHSATGAKVVFGFCLKIPHIKKKSATTTIVHTHNMVILYPITIHITELTLMNTHALLLYIHVIIRTNPNL